MNRNDLDPPNRVPTQDPDPFSGLGPPTIPLGLRQRVLTRARSQAAAAPSWVDRLWESPSLRWGWLASVVLLVVIQTGLAATMGEPPAARTASTSAPAAETVPELESDGELGVWLARHPVREPESMSPRGLRPENLGTDRRL